MQGMPSHFLPQEDLNMLENGPMSCPKREKQADFFGFQAEKR